MLIDVFSEFIYILGGQLILNSIIDIMDALNNIKDCI